MGNYGVPVRGARIDSSNSLFKICLKEQLRNIEMLELRPTCENCNKLLPPDSIEAMICTYECTFCRSCFEKFLNDVCPNCGGGFCPRPIRPKMQWKSMSLEAYPASEKIKHRPIKFSEYSQMAEKVKHLSPDKR